MRTDGKTAKATIALYRKELIADKARVAQLCILIPVGHLLRYVVLPLLVSLIIQSLITDPGNINRPLWYIAITAIAMIVATLTNDRGYTLLFRHEERAQTRLLEQGTRHLMAHSYTFFSNQKTGTLSGDLMNFGRAYVQMMDTYFLQTNQLIVSFVASLVVIGALAPILLLPTLLIMAAIILLNMRNIRARAPYRNKRKHLTSQLNGTLADIVGNQLLVRMFAKEQYETAHVYKERTKIEQIAYKEIQIIERESFYRQAILYTFHLIILLLFVWLFTANRISIAGLIFTFSYMSRSTDSIFAVSGLVRNFEQALLDAAPMTKILQMTPDIIDGKEATDLSANSCVVNFHDVTFTYGAGKTEGVFYKLNLTIPAGQRVGLAGHSGGGKTTLTKLLLRFLDISDGSISIDGQDIRTVTQQSLRSAISYVPQDPYLFHRSLRENIAYGKADATEAEIIAVCKKAYIYDLIESLPDGLDTVVGERGIKLSGGQRQRVAIARAILRDTPLLILDEATSALDSESEQHIQEALQALMKDRTCIVIAHRLSTISQLDRILVLEDGTIVEDGKHANLLKNSGTYAKLWAHQSGGFLED